MKALVNILKLGYKYSPYIIAVIAIVKFAVDEFEKIQIDKELKN